MVVPRAPSRPAMVPLMSAGWNINEGKYDPPPPCTRSSQPLTDQLSSRHSTIVNSSVMHLQLMGVGVFRQHRLISLLSSIFGD